MAESAPAPDAAPSSSSDLTTKLDQLKAQATQQYSLKNYSAAADLYSEAAEVQDEINGEMSPENAELLYHYGRCLYHVAVQNSDVLGGKVAGTTTEEPKRKKRKTAPADNGEGSSSSAGGLIGNAIKAGGQVDAAGSSAVKKEEPATTSKPFFQITGDENWTDSEGDDDDDEAEAGDGEPEEVEDDFATAYEILDMARVLLARKIEAVHASSTDDEASTAATELRQLEERLADTHDLQAEISLENERFTDAVSDTRDALALKLKLYPQESSLVAEAHFKLSLALEFASVTSTEDAPAAADGSSAGGDRRIASVDEAMRAEAATEMEAALASCRLRIAKETTNLETLQSAGPEKKAAADDLARNLADIKDMVADMEQRLKDLRSPATSLSAFPGAAGGGDALGSNGEADALRGVLGAMLGESKAGQQALLAQATQNANDLSGLVVKKGKKRAATTEEEAGSASTGKGKRKVEEDEADAAASGAAAAGRNGNGKKVKFEDVPEEE